MATKPQTVEFSEVAQLDSKVAGAKMSIAVFEQFEDARNDWLELIEVAPVSPYQSYLFLATWQEKVGREQYAEPFIVVARNAAGRPLALLPLCIETRGPLRIATFMGGRESNFNLGLFRPGAFDERKALELLQGAAKQAANPPDLYYLRNQPRQFEGAANPLAFAKARPSASYAYGLTLPADEAALAARLSKDARKKLRKKEARLAEIGQLSYEHVARGARAQDIATALIDQKSARFADLGVGGLFESAGMRALVRALSAVEGDGALELHALSVDERIVATYAGVVRKGRFSGIFNSFDMDEEIARSSPGELLLHALMRNLVARGMTHFDLGAGEARYKQSVCDETIELVDAIVPVSAMGAVAAPALRLFLIAKRRIKQTPRLARAAARLRRFIGRLR